MKPVGRLSERLSESLGWRLIDLRMAAVLLVSLAILGITLARSDELRRSRWIQRMKAALFDDARPSQAVHARSGAAGSSHADGKAPLGENAREPNDPNPIHPTRESSGTTASPANAGEALRAALDDFQRNGKAHASSSVTITSQGKLSTRTDGESTTMGGIPTSQFQGAVQLSSGAQSGSRQ